MIPNKIVIYGEIIVFSESDKIKISEKSGKSKHLQWV